MNIILKSFDGHPVDKAILERALREISIGTCISIANTKTFLPTIDAREHIWMPAEPLRKGEYPINWNEIAPLDQPLIESMRGCEALFMTMIERYSRGNDMPYAKRRQQYFAHLRYWNHELTARKIDFVLMNHVPHQCYDFVIECLCKLKGIPTLYLERLVIDTMLLIEDWRHPAADIRDRFQELRKEHAHGTAPIPLSDAFEYYVGHYKSKKPAPWYKPALPASPQ